ncbi:MAG: hypothetical protein U5J83_16075 [Bryobacterales bacterium]|nr:hypothetical protein [Bryobacterales bacterium]
MKSTKSLTLFFAFAMLLAASVALFPNAAVAAAQDAPQVQVQEESWTGTVEQKDVQGMKTYVLTVGGQSIPLDPQDKAAEFVGKNVKVTGKLEGGKVVISSIEEA